MGNKWIKIEKWYFSETDSLDGSLCSVDRMEKNTRKIKKIESNEIKKLFVV
jgi:hypothetical protein